MSTATQERLPESMQAIVCHGPNDYRLETVATPRPGPEEIVVRIGGCGICASDIKAKHGAGMFWDGEESWLKAPVIPGHEFFGTVVAMGPAAGHGLGVGDGGNPSATSRHGVAIGDRVVAEQINPCGECRYCRSGKYWMCERHDIFGFQKDVAEGGMAEYMRFPRTAIVHRIPPELSFNESVIIEPLACAIHTVERADVQLADVVVLAGAGPLGLSMVQVIALKTPKKLVVLDMEDSRLRLAKELGADVVLNPGKTDAVAEVKAMTDGYGCDVYIEATGHPSGVGQGLQMIRKLGRFVEFSVFGQESTVDWSIIGDRKELDVRGAHLAPYTYPIAIDLLQRKKVNADKIVTDVFSLDQHREAFQKAESPLSIKAVFRMGG